MTWVKLDDRFFDNPKIAAISDAAQLAHLKAMTYCARELTDGFISLKKGKEFAAPKVVKELVPGLWELAEGGFMVHDYLQYNPTREQVLAERDAAKRRMQGVRSGDVRANRPRTSPEVHTEVPPTPVSRIPDPLSLLPLLPPRDDVSKLLVEFGAVGAMNAATVGDIEECIEIFTLDWVQKAVGRARGSGKSELPWNWCRSVLEGWKAQGGPDEPRIQSPRNRERPGAHSAVANLESSPFAHIGS